MRIGVPLKPLILVFSVLTLAGCFGAPEAPPEPKAKEIPTTLAKPSELTEEELIFRAKRYYELGLYGEAKENFEAIQATFPLGPYAEFAEIKAADALFDARSFIEAAQAYDSIAMSRPVSEALPYILFRSGRSYQLAQRGIGRDMTMLDRAQEKYEELLKRFPTSRHALAAQELLAAVLESKAAYAESIRIFYERQGQTRAANMRAKRIASMISPAVETARAQSESAQVLQTAQQSELPGIRERVEREKSLSAEPIQTKESSTPPPPDRNDSARYHVVRAECVVRGDELQATIFTNRDISNLAWLTEIKRSAAWRIPDAQADTELATRPCRGSDAVLHITAQGAVSISGIDEISHSVLTTTLSNPPRLIILATVQ